MIREILQAEYHYLLDSHLKWCPVCSTRYGDSLCPAWARLVDEACKPKQTPLTWRRLASAFQIASKEVMLRSATLSQYVKESWEEAGREVEQERLQKLADKRNRRS